MTLCYCQPDCCWRGVQSGWDCFGYEYNRPTKDVVIRNVTAVYSEAAGCAIGSEMSGGMENITVRDQLTCLPLLTQSGPESG